MFGVPTEFQQLPSPNNGMVGQMPGLSPVPCGSPTNGGQQHPMVAAVMSPPKQEFCIKLSMASIEGRPLSLTLARYDDYDNPLIGCSKGFLDLSGLNRQGVLGKNCRFLNTGLKMDLRERLHHSVRSGTPFMGVLTNVRHLGQGGFETFENLLHLVLIVAGARRYIVGFQADVTGLGLDIAEGSLDALRLQKMFDSVLSASVDSWIHFQEGMFFSAPLYLYIRYGGFPGSGDEVEIREEESGVQGRSLAAPDQCMVLAPRFPPTVPEHDQSMKWRFLLLGDNEAGGAQQDGSPPVLNLSQALPFGDCAGQDFRSESGANFNDEANHWTSTMKNQLRALNMEDPACVLSVRGISKLGVESAAKIRAHFSCFGQVKAVHVPIVFKKRSKEPRSAGKCFLVMNSTLTVDRILQRGTDHQIDEVTVSIERFAAAATGSY